MPQFFASIRSDLTTLLAPGVSHFSPALSPSFPDTIPKITIPL
jgi:hypothetical protein